jgi:hypothetical protein
MMSVPIFRMGESPSQGKKQRRVTIVTRRVGWQEA